MDLQRQFEAALAEVARQDEIKLTELIFAAIGDAVGRVVGESNWRDFLPRISVRQYPDGVFILALDAEPETEHRRGTYGRVLMGFGEAELKPTPAGWKVVRDLYDAQQALAYELRQQQPVQVYKSDLNAEQNWARDPLIRERMLYGSPRVQRGDMPTGYFG
ncbi:hypothetical protein [Hymenobacter sp. YC55]|uniref:hypothetical protein n=1 Tax=Hymenobacter sp. YC55 TaxID=3034019 RepID=UPI0023F68066|nr:hypothetical protein [Hymenobacter sp. YC55]MDF7809929.1 hypothetical protein [Hymenobacter sp. YC55]